MVQGPWGSTGPTFPDWWFSRARGGRGSAPPSGWPRSRTHGSWPFPSTTSAGGPPTGWPCSTPAPTARRGQSSRCTCSARWARPWWCRSAPAGRSSPACAPATSSWPVPPPSVKGRRSITAAKGRRRPRPRWSTRPARRLPGRGFRVHAGPNFTTSALFAQPPGSGCVVVGRRLPGRRHGDVGRVQCGAAFRHGRGVAPVRLGRAAGRP